MPLAQRALHPQATTASYFYGLWSKFLENDALDRLANLAALQIIINHQRLFSLKKISKIVVQNSWNL